MTLYKDSLRATPLPSCQSQTGSRPTSYRRDRGFVALLLLVIYWLLQSQHWPNRPDSTKPVIDLDSFFWSRNDASSLCNGSYSGYIGLHSEIPDRPRRSFYWLFAAQNGDEHAPVVLTIGGGPGTSGLLNALFGQSHCLVAEGKLIPNPHAWSARFNVLALDHPIGTGFSYGKMVDNSIDASHDVYDFLQKFFVLFPRLARNPLVLASGSYGGVYVPNIATVINEHNKELAAGRGPRGAQHLNLESLMISNPLSDFFSDYAWKLQQACYITNLFNETQCAEKFQLLPQCLEDTMYAYENPTVKAKRAAFFSCYAMDGGDTHGRALDNIEHECGSDPIECSHSFAWAVDILNSTYAKHTLGVSKDFSYEAVSGQVSVAFVMSGDFVQRSYLLHTQLLADGIRVLHYLGQLDNIVGPPSTVSFLRRLPSHFLDEFRGTADLPWPAEDSSNVTIRAIGPGAGNLTMVLMASAGHFVTKDQPALVKQIADIWISNTPWFPPGKN